MSRPQHPTQGTDPFDIALKILTAQSNNPAMALYMEQIKAQNNEIQEMRKERETALRAEIAALRANPNNSSSGDWIENLNKLATAKDTLAKLLGVNSEAGAAAPIVRSKMSATMEFLRDIVPQVLNAPIVTAAASWLMSNPAGPAPQPGTAIQQPGQPQTAAPSAADFQQFIQFATPPMLQYLSAETADDPEQSTGQAFASWMHAGYPQWFKRLQGITHPGMPNVKGAPVLIGFYQTGPGRSYWPQILAACQNDAAKFTKFVTDFCDWSPEGEAPAESEPQASGSSETIDNETERVEV